ncbi:tll2313 [Thermosynechococcus vestitus BP-1]|uniref:Tll2313 protein n=1 Tax=Thermosynechococcus vestitus (strain NIES-2133 / IAM M-273 / BP-1) TaxID=197221 RepID=Q8DGK4_THEVB|nr:tll2313 [Thermosynechococcus vestitus BP-1]
MLLQKRTGSLGKTDMRNLHFLASQYPTFPHKFIIPHFFVACSQFGADGLPALRSLRKKVVELNLQKADTPDPAGRNQQLQKVVFSAFDVYFHQVDLLECQFFKNTVCTLNASLTLWRVRLHEGYKGGTIALHFDWQQCIVCAQTISIHLDARDRSKSLDTIRIELSHWLEQQHPTAELFVNRVCKVTTVRPYINHQAITGQGIVEAQRLVSTVPEPAANLAKKGITKDMELVKVAETISEAGEETHSKGFSHSTFKLIKIPFSLSM